MRLFIFSIGLLVSTNLIAQCGLTNFSFSNYPFANDFDDISVYVNFVESNNNVFLTTIASGGSESVSIESETNAFFQGPGLVIENIVFMTGCRVISLSTFTTNCQQSGGAGSVCTFTGECSGDAMVWTPPSILTPKCNNITLTFTKGFGPAPPSEFLISYVTTVTNCPDTLSLTQAPIMPEVYHANNIVSNQTVETTGLVNFKVQTSAVLNPNFNVPNGGMFTVENEDCPN